MLINNSKELTHLVKSSQSLIHAISQINLNRGENPIKAAKMEVGIFSNFYGKFIARENRSRHAADISQKE